MPLPPPSVALRLSVALGLATTAAAQSPTTLSAPVGPAPAFVDGTAAGQASYLDLDIADIQGITLTEIGLLSPVANTPHTIEVWVQSGDSAFLQWGANRFSLVATATTSSGPAHTIFPVDIPDVPLAAGTHGLAIVNTNLGSGQSWNVGTFGATSTDGTVTMTPWGWDQDFAGQSDFNLDNIVDGFAGSISYTIGSGLPPAPGYVAPFGTGCDSSLGPVTMRPLTTSPRVGFISVFQCDNAPQGGQFHFGVSNTFNATFGVPLPQALQPIFGAAPRCNLQVGSDQIVWPVVQQPGFFRSGFGVPNNPILGGLTVYYQAVAFDPAVPGGIAISDAWLAVIRP